MRLQLVDHDGDVVRALTEAFAAWPEVLVRAGDLPADAQGCVVSPANSHGFMDGGIDRHFREWFGPDVEDRVRAAAQARPEGLIPIGASELVATGHVVVPWLLVVPTMEHPEAIPPVNVLRAMSAMLRAVDRHGLDEVFCPGLGTGVGEVPPDEAARQMAAAYARWKGRAGPL